MKRKLKYPMPPASQRMEGMMKLLHAMDYLYKRRATKRTIDVLWDAYKANYKVERDKRMGN